MRVITIVNVLVWSAWTWVGWNALANVAAEKLAAYPNHRQMEYYLYFPIAMVVLTAAGYALSRFSKAKSVALLVEILVLAMVFPFFFGYTGGM
jgi:hypothetical protein